MRDRPQVSASCHICRTSLTCGRCDIRSEPQVLPDAWQSLEAVREVLLTKLEVHESMTIKMDLNNGGFLGLNLAKYILEGSLTAI